jgi:hypothetical protein
MSTQADVDDETILNSDGLWRRIPHWHLIRDENLNRVRPSSAAFDDDQDGSPMSICIQSIVTDAGRGAQDIIDGLENFSVAGITVELARELQQKIARDPLPEEPAHGLVIGKKKNSVRKRFAKECRWIIDPSGEALAAQFGDQP